MAGEPSPAANNITTHIFAILIDCLPFRSQLGGLRKHHSDAYDGAVLRLGTCSRIQGVTKANNRGTNDWETRHQRANSGVSWNRLSSVDSKGQGRVTVDPCRGADQSQGFH